MAEVCESKCVGGRPEDKHLSLKRYCELPQLYEALEGWKSVCGQPNNLRA